MASIASYVFVGVIAGSLIAEPGISAAATPISPAAFDIPGQRVAARRRKRKRRRKRPAPATNAETPATTPTPGPTVPANLPPPPDLSTKLKVVAVLPLETIDIDDDTAHSVEVALLREIEESKGMQSVTPKDVLNDLKQYALTTTCEGDTACVARAGRYARAHLALEARVASIGGTINIALRLVDTQKAAELNRVSDPVSEDPQRRAPQLHRLAVQLLRPETYIGSLQIACSQDGASVFVDDKLVGTTPLEKTLEGLRAGPHILRITKTGFSDLHRFVDVVYRRSSTIEVDLSTNTIAGTIIEEESTAGFGALFVATNTEGLEIRVDGEPRGSTPLTEPIEKIAAGKRRLSLHLEGAHTLQREVVIVADRRTDLSVRFSDGAMSVREFGVVNASAPLPSENDVAALALGTEPSQAGVSEGWSPGFKFIAGLTLAGLGAGGVATSSVLAGQVDKLNSENERLLAEARCSIGEGPDGCVVPDNFDPQKAVDTVDANNKKGPTLERIQWIALGAGAGLIAVGVAMVIWDIVSGPSEPNTSLGVEQSDSGSVSVGLAPLVGGGTMLQLQWSF